MKFAVIFLYELPSSLTNFDISWPVKYVHGQLRHLHAHRSTGLRKEDQMTLRH